MFYDVQGIPLPRTVGSLVHVVVIFLCLTAVKGLGMTGLEGVDNSDCL